MTDPTDALFDGIYGPKFAAAGFYGMLSDTMQGVVRTRLEGISNTENLRAMLGCNPTLRYDGNGNYTAL